MLFYRFLMTPSLILYILDLIGCAACAAAASLLAHRVRFDFVGAVAIGAIAAIGGGTVRDVILNRHPIFWLQDTNYLYLVTLVALLVQIFYHTVEKMDKPLRLFDAIGLATFSVIGFEAALSKGFSGPIIIVMGVITSVMGGVLRDMICGQLPMVLRKEVYILTTVAGGLFYLAMLHYSVDVIWRGSLTMIAIFSLRMLAVYRNWNLPSITLKPRR